MSYGQVRDGAFPTDVGTTTSVLSPLHHLAPLHKGGNPRVAAGNVYLCAPNVYYDTSGSTVTYSQNVPTSLWAARLSPLSTYAKVCTVWTVTVDFELTNAPATARDTIQIVIKDGTPPYSELWTTWYIARVGDNVGELEIDPPPSPPYTRPVINPMRDIYVGYYIRGGSTHTVNFHFKSPQIHTNPIRSVMFTSSGTFVSAAVATGQDVEWSFEARMCCNNYIPTEMSAFSGVHDGSCPRFALGPGYPGPLSLQSSIPVTIPYQLAEQSDFRLSVHDVLGREIAVLADGMQAAGHHEHRWFPYASGIRRSGTYFMRLTTPVQSAVRKLSIIE